MFRRQGAKFFLSRLGRRILHTPCDAKAPTQFTPHQPKPRVSPPSATHRLCARAAPFGSALLPTHATRAAASLSDSTDTLRPGLCSAQPQSSFPHPSQPQQHARRSREGVHHRPAGRAEAQDGGASPQRSALHAPPSLAALLSQCGALLRALCARTSAVASEEEHHPRGAARQRQGDAGASAALLNQTQTPLLLLYSTAARAADSALQPRPLRRGSHCRGSSAGAADKGQVQAVPPRDRRFATRRCRCWCAVPLLEAWAPGAASARPHEPHTGASRAADPRGWASGLSRRERAYCSTTHGSARKRRCTRPLAAPLRTAPLHRPGHTPRGALRRPTDAARLCARRDGDGEGGQGGYGEGRPRLG